MGFLEDEERVTGEVCDRLIGQGLLEPLSGDPVETRAWLDRELASLVEGNFHHILDPAAIVGKDREAWEPRVTWRGRGLTTPHGGYRRPFWLMHGRERAGTFAVTTMFRGGCLIDVSSLYVQPDHRRQGLARCVLEATRDAATAAGASGICLSTSWCWSHAVQTYARLRMWVRTWKHDLVFMWDGALPDHRVWIEGTQARFCVVEAGGERELLSAQNRGDTLGWTRHEAYEAMRESRPMSELYFVTPGTFALHLALAGWPLIRSPDLWQRRHDWCDCGEPEGLAYKIEIFEAVAREEGRSLRTVRVPGLSYRDLDDID